jgi:hypothetical protein
MSSIASIMSLVSSLSQAEKLELNALLAASMAGTGAKTSSRKGKPAAPGTKAWSAFIEHAKTRWPERFAPPALPKDRMAIAKAIKDEDPAAYKAFCEQYIAEHPAVESDSEAASVAPKEDKPEKPKRVISEEQKAKMKAGREAAKAKKDAAAAEAGTPPKTKGKTKVAAPSKPKPAASEGGGGAAPAMSQPLSQPVFESSDSGMQLLEIGGDSYYLVTATNNLYAVEDEGLGAYVGRYQPGDEEEIDFTAEEDA